LASAIKFVQTSVSYLPGVNVMAIILGPIRCLTVPRGRPTAPWIKDASPDYEVVFHGKLLNKY